MVRRILQTTLLLTVFLVSLSAGLSAADDPSFGTWKLNLAKSKFSPGPAPKSQIVKYEAWEDGFKVSIDVVDALGKANHSEFTAKFDGKEYPWKGNANADLATVKKIDDRHMESTWKKDGKTTITIKNAIAPDGKSRTVTHSGTDAQGRTVNTVMFFDKQ